MKAETVAIRDQLAAMLRETEVASGHELAKGLPPRRFDQPCRPGYHLAPRVGRHPSIVAEVCCPGCGRHHLSVRRRLVDIWDDLVALERSGLASQVLPGVFVWVGSPGSDLMARRAEAIWEATQ